MVIVNQESILNRVCIIEEKQADLEEAISFTYDSIEVLQKQANISTNSIAECEKQLQETATNHTDLQDEIHVLPKLQSALWRNPRGAF